MKILGVLLIIAGIVLGLYVGIWVMFIGGIIGLITQAVEISNGNIYAMEIGLNIGKLLFATLIGWVSGLLPIVTGIGLLMGKTKRRKINRYNKK